MRTSKFKNGLTGLALIMAAGLAAPAIAQEEGPVSVSANVALTSDYRFRGVGLSDGNIAVQGGIDVAHESGFYIGTWASSLASVDDTAPFDDGTGTVISSPIGNYGAIELDIYAGWSGEVVSGITVDVGALYYLYPDALNTTTISSTTAGTPPVVSPTGLEFFNSTTSFDTDYYEFYGSVSGDIGPASLEVGVAYAPKQDSLGGTDNLYVYSDLGFAIPNTPLSLSAHIGYTDGFLTFTNNGKAFDYSVGAEFAITDNLSIGVSYVGVEGPSIKNLTDDTVVGTLSFSF